MADATRIPLLPRVRLRSYLGSWSSRWKSNCASEGSPDLSRSGTSSKPWPRSSWPARSRSRCARQPDRGALPARVLHAREADAVIASLLSDPSDLVARVQAQLWQREHDALMTTDTAS